MRKLIKRILWVVSGLILLSNIGYSQFDKGLYVAFGLSSNEIMGDDLGKKPFIERDTGKPDVVGGGFSSSNPGVSLLFTFPLDKEERFRVPLAVDYHFYEGLQKVPYTRHYIFYLKHRIDMFSAFIGINYVFLNLPLAQTKLYVGLDLKASLMSGNTYTSTLIHSSEPELSGETLRRTKNDAFRFGPGIRLGFEGTVFEPWYINASWSATMINALGRDDARGELFTPNIDNEGKESISLNMNFSFLIQYRFN